MSKQIIIAEQHRIAAVFSEEQIQELIVAKGSHQVSDIYYGVVENVLPGIDAAFVNIGDTERNGFIHVTDLGPLRLKRMSGSITELLAPQQKVLVQVMKEPTGNKGPRLTGNISLPGRYLVLMPYGKGVNLSRRIRNDNERNRLRALAILIKPAGMGLVVRTEADGMPEDAIMKDLEVLLDQWENILQEANSTRAPALLNRDDDFIQRVLRDTFSADVNRIVVDSHTGVKRVKQHLMHWSGGRLPQSVLIDHHKERIPILDYFRVNAVIRESLKPRVDLPSGGYIIIQPTEALTVIDVNSGSFTRSATARETVLWTNCEAATEIARQLRLRNVAGVIIVDFIDMDSRRDQLQLLEHFNKALKADKSRPQIAQLSELGLVELTRKRQGQNIYELFGQTCPTCNGLGHIVHLPGERGIPHEEEELPEVAAATSQPIYEPGTPRFRTRVSAPAREVRDLVSSESPTWDAWGEGGGLESEADATESELLHHPSYQERGNGRRRRRRRPGEILKPTSAEERSPSFASKERYGAWEEGDREPSAELDVFASAPEDLTLATAKKGRPDRQRVPRKLPEPGEVKVSTELSKPAPEPKEVVVVEMTPQEQEVYAWMGVSPLVKINREIKNPRSVVVAVALPGQKPDGLGASLEPQLISALATEPLPEAPFLESEVVSSMSEGVPRPSRRLTFPVPQPDITQLPDTIAVAEIDRAEERSVELADVPDSDPSAASPEEPSTRRRRRRTSATSSDSPIGVIE